MHDEAPRNPLERFTSGGWTKGALRLLLGLAILGAVVHFAARDAVDLIAERAVTGSLALGAAVHLLQRIARIAKWSRMIGGARLIERRWTFLLRIQLVGMLANLLLPISEALKIWAVSRNRRDVLVSTKSLLLDLMLHSAMVGAAGLVGALLVGSSDPLVWAVAAALAIVPLLVIGAFQWRDREERTVRILDARVLGWCAVETVCQISIYAIAARTIALGLGDARTLALAPLLYLGDLVMLTPSGLGLREALFAVVLGSPSRASTDAGVAMALLVSAMLLIAAALGGAAALVVPRRSEDDGR